MNALTSTRIADHPIDQLFIDRWSPRAFTGEPLPQADLATMIEAARWAPSAFNSQPWRFVYAHYGTPAFADLLDALIPFNQAWARNASVLLFAVSSPTFTRPGKSETQISVSHSFDTGAAFAHLALQATRLGWFAHGMGGFDHGKARAAMAVPTDHRIEAAVAIGRIGALDVLPDYLRKQEVPSGRRLMSEILFEGRFPEP